MSAAASSAYGAILGSGVVCTRGSVTSANLRLRHTVHAGEPRPFFSTPQGGVRPPLGVTGEPRKRGGEGGEEKKKEKEGKMERKRRGSWERERERERERKKKEERRRRKGKYKVGKMSKTALGPLNPLP